MEEVGREGGLCIIRCPKVALKKVNEFTIELRSYSGG